MYHPDQDMETPQQPRFLDESGDTADAAAGGHDDNDPDDSQTGGDVDASAASANPNAAAAAAGNASDEEEEEEDDDEVADDDGTAQAGQVGTPGVPTPNLLVIPAVPNLDSLYGLREIGREALCWQLSSAKPGNGVEQIRDHSTETYWQSDGTAQPHWIQVHFARRVAISHVCLYLDYNLDESYTPRRLTVQVGMTNHDLGPAILPQNTLVEFQEPTGWCIVPLRTMPDPLEDGEDEEDDSDEEDEDDDMDEEERLHKKANRNKNKRVVKAHLVQISILSQHQNGRDTHVRQVQLYGPRTNSAAALRKVHTQGITDGTHAGNSNQQGASDDAKKNSNDHMAGHSDRLLLQRGRHWDEEFSTVAMSQFSTVR